MIIAGVDIETMMADLFAKHEWSKRFLEFIAEAVDELQDSDEICKDYFVMLTESAERIETTLFRIKELINDESIPVCRISSEVAMSSFVIMSFHKMCLNLKTLLFQAEQYAQGISKQPHL